MARPAPKCKICQVDDAAVPDRNRPSTTWRREICRRCHSKRLVGDLKQILRTVEERKPKT